MKRAIIERIAPLVPHPDTWLSPDHDDSVLRVIPLAMANRIRRIQTLLGRPDAGWIIAKSYAREEIMPPAWFKEQTIRRTIKLLMGKENNAVLMEAIALSGEMAAGACNLIHALLLNDGCNYDEISRISGIPQEVIRAHEELFFNVRDRRDEQTYLSGIVYPNGRIDELRPDYFDAAGNRELLLRTGFNSTVRQTAFLAGLQMASPYAQGNNAEKTDRICRDMLERAAMATGMGIANSSRHPLGPVIRQVAVNAAHQVKPDGFGQLISLGDTMKQELEQLARNKAEALNRNMNDIPREPVPLTSNHEQ